MSAFDGLDDEDLLDDGRNLAPASVLSNLGIMIGLSFFIILCFNFLRPKHRVIYAPKLKYHKGDKAPPKISDSLFGWIPPLIHTKEDQMFELVGLDAVAFLRFLRFCRQLFLGITVIAGGVLIPINYTYSRRKSADVLSRMTIRDVYDDYLWAHIVVVYIITFLLLGLLFVHWKQMLQLRRRWFTSAEYTNSLYSRTISILNIPSKYRSDDGLRNILAATKMPYPITSLSMGRRLGFLPDLIETHNETVRQFEAVLVKYLKNGRIGRHRPKIRIGTTLGMGGREHDAISYYATKIKASNATIREARQRVDMRAAENYGFATLAAVPYAHEVARRLHTRHPKGTEIDMAMNPKAIIWKNMTLAVGTSSRRKLFGWIWMILLCFFSLIPTALVAILAIMDVIARVGLVPRLQDWIMISPATYAIVSGTLPPVTAGIWTYILPKIMRRISKNMGAKTTGRLNRAVVARFFAFLVISQLVIFTIWGVIFISVAEVIGLVNDNRNWREIILRVNEKLPGRISSAYIEQSNYWLKFIPLRGFLVIFDLAQLANLTWVTIKTRLWGRTPRDIRDWTQPPPFDYPVYYANLLFTAAVGLLFAPVAPLVSCAALVVFLLSTGIYKYQLLFVFVTKVESGGRLWNMAVNRLLVGAFLMQLLFALIIGLRSTFISVRFFFTIPPLILVIAFKMYTKAKFATKFRWYIPETAEEMNQAKVHSERGDVNNKRLENRFGHPALHANLIVPMIHENMIPLLPQVFGEKEITEYLTVDLKEYGGEKMSAVRVGGLVFASVSKNVLQYDPVLYQRDRGEMNWDRASMATTTLLSTAHGPSTAASSSYDPRPSSYYYHSTPTPAPMSPPPAIAETSSLLPPANPAYFDYHQTPARHSMVDNNTGYSRPSSAVETLGPSSPRASTYGNDPAAFTRAPMSTATPPVRGPSWYEVENVNQGTRPQHQSQPSHSSSSTLLYQQQQQQPQLYQQHRGSAVVTGSPATMSPAVDGRSTPWSPASSTTRVISEYDNNGHRRGSSSSLPFATIPPNDGFNAYHPHDVQAGQHGRGSSYYSNSQANLDGNNGPRGPW